MISLRPNVVNKTPTKQKSYKKGISLTVTKTKCLNS